MAAQRCVPIILIWIEITISNIILPTLVQLKGLELKYINTVDPNAFRMDGERYTDKDTGKMASCDIILQD